eukprot:3180085-Amphidinium_carterae.3
MVRCYALLVMLALFVVFPLQNITNVDVEYTPSCEGLQVTSDHCYRMELLAQASHSALFPILVNTSEPATVLTSNRTLSDIGFVDDYESLYQHPYGCEPATTIDAVLTSVCDRICSVHQFTEQPSLSSSQELNIYYFDAVRLAGSFGRLGLHRQFIVALTNNGSSSFEDPTAVNVGDTFEFLMLPYLCVRPCLEVANPDLLESIRIVAIKWKRYLKLRADTYNPHTKNNCLFMCVAFILRQHGIFMSQQQVRNRSAKLWLAGATCFGGSLAHWATVSNLSPESFIIQLRTNGWGSAADACILANSLQASCYIYDAKGTLLVSSPCSRCVFNMNFRLAGEHYTVVDNKNIEIAQRHLSSCYWYKTKTSSSWQRLRDLPSFLKSNGIAIPPLASVSRSPSCSSTSLRTVAASRSSSCYPTCFTASFEEQLMAFQQSLAGGWLRRSSRCSSNSFLHHGGAGGRLRVSNILRFYVPGVVQQFSGVRFQTAYVSAGLMHVGMGVAPPPVPLVIYLSGLDCTDRIDDDCVEKHFAKQGNAPGAFLMLFRNIFPLRPRTHWWMADKYSDLRKLGWLEGNLDSAFLDNMHNLFDLAIRHPQVDPTKFFVFGFSAGGYALTEMIASNRGLKARAIFLGGIHGHGNTVEEAKKFHQTAKQGQLALESYENKWEHYIQRMRHRPNRHVPVIVAVHNVLDTLSPWGPAQVILDALDATRIFDAVPGIQRVLLNRAASNSMGSSAHNYGKEAMQQLYLLMAVAAREDFTAQDDIEVIGPDGTLPTPLPSSLASTSSSSTQIPPSLPSNSGNGAASSSTLPSSPLQGSLCRGHGALRS